MSPLERQWAASQGSTAPWVTAGHGNLHPTVPASRWGRGTALLFPESNQPAPGQDIPLNSGIRDATALPKKPQLHLRLTQRPGESCACCSRAQPACFCLPDRGFIYLLLLEQSCKPQPQYRAVASTNRMGFGLGFLFVFIFPVTILWSWFMSRAHWITRSQTVTGWLPAAHVTPVSLSCMSSHKSKASAGKGTVSWDRTCILGRWGIGSKRSLRSKEAPVWPC